MQRPHPTGTNSTRWSVGAGGGQNPFFFVGLYFLLSISFGYKHISIDIGCFGLVLDAAGVLSCVIFEALVY